VGEVALDASVAIGFLDPADAHHERAVATLRELDRPSLTMAASTYSETLVRPLAGGHADVVENFIDKLRIEIVPLDRTIAWQAAELRAKHASLRLPDAIALATAEARDARLLTFDDRLASLAESGDTEAV
jgi:predicted nucleic acid-binding protein